MVEAVSEVDSVKIVKLLVNLVQPVIFALLHTNPTLNDNRLIEQSEAHVVVRFLLHCHVNSPIDK